MAYIKLSAPRRVDYAIVPENLPVIVSRTPRMVPVSGFGDTVLPATPIAIKSVLSPEDVSRVNQTAAIALHDQLNNQKAQAVRAAALANQAAAQQAAAAKKAAAQQLAAQRAAAALAARQAAQVKAQQAAVAAAQARATAQAAAAQKAAATKQQQAIAAAQAQVTRTATVIANQQAVAAKAQLTINTSNNPTAVKTAQTTLLNANNNIAAALQQQDSASQVLAAAGVQPNAAKVVTSYQAAAPVTTANSGLPSSINNVGTLPLALPGQAPGSDQTIQLIQASTAGSISGLTAPSPVPVIVAAPTPQVDPGSTPISAGTTQIQNFFGTTGGAAPAVMPQLTSFADASGVPTSSQFQTPAPVTVPVRTISPLVLVGGAVLLILLLRK